MWFYILCTLLFLNSGVYLLHHLLVSVWYKTQNLKKRYNAEWALVTGASSGIGKSIATRLAKQGLNVVLVALGDDLLDNTHKELTTTFPALQFRKVPVDLSKEGYLEPLAAATSDITVQVCFLNAGYMITGFFYARPIEQLMGNLHCNSISPVAITHLFLRRMIAAKKRGCLVYTSSAAASIPSPFSVQYAATKSFLSTFGASLAPEAAPHGVDVLVVHPSPVASRFYDKAHKIDALEMFKRLAVSPDDLPDAIFASVGRTVYRDIGPTAIGFRFVPKILDYNFLAFLITRTAHFMPDFKRQAVEAEALMAKQK
jgi:short-subunit dehydrogenase